MKALEKIGYLITREFEALFRIAAVTVISFFTALIVTMFLYVGSFGGLGFVVLSVIMVCCVAAPVIWQVAHDDTIDFNVFYTDCDLHI
jgi:hypothetical protein